MSGVKGKRLTDEQRFELIRLYTRTDTPVEEIAAQFGLKRTAVVLMAKRYGFSVRPKYSGLKYG